MDILIISGEAFKSSMISKCQKKNSKILEYFAWKLTIAVIHALFCTESYSFCTKLVTDHLFGTMAGWKYLQLDKTAGNSNDVLPQW